LFERSREGPKTGNYHFEIELVVALAKGGRDIAVEQALDHVFGYAVGLDMTRRDLQDEAKQLRRPWEWGKAADHSGPVGPIHPASAVGHPANGTISLTVDGAITQKGRSVGHDLVGGRADRLSLGLFRACARRRDLLRHSGWRG
jgi:2-keto-4-pentenoate hydratase/2-oxohepta-3-ene-1,7-dioic acid hydratase in catechol pathway